MLKIYQKESSFSPGYRLWLDWFDFLSFFGYFLQSSWVYVSCWSGCVVFMFNDLVFIDRFAGLFRVLSVVGISGLSFRTRGGLLV